MRNVVGFLAIALSIACASPTNAQQGNHGEGHDELHHWYRSLRSPSKAWCCSEQDCRPSRHRYSNGVLEILVDGEWRIVPPNTLLDQPSQDLQTHVCALPATRRPGLIVPGRIICVVLGAGA